MAGLHGGGFVGGKLESNGEAVGVDDLADFFPGIEPLPGFDGDPGESAGQR